MFEHNFQRGDLYCSNGRLIYINTPQFPFIYFFGFISFFGSKKMSNQKKSLQSQDAILRSVSSTIWSVWRL